MRLCNKNLQKLQPLRVVMSRLPVKPPSWAVTPAAFCGRGPVRGGNQRFCFALKNVREFVFADQSAKSNVP
jgi:hypothetical protein